MPPYLKAAKSDAKDAARYWMQEICEQITDTGSASDDMGSYQYGDSYVNERVTSPVASLADADDLLDALEQYEETDAGLWAGEKPRAAILSQAEFTYQNAVRSLWGDLIREINDGSDIADSRQAAVDAQVVVEEGPDDDDGAGERVKTAAAAVLALQSAVESVIDAF